MNRTSKRIICLSVQTLDQPKDQPWHQKQAPNHREFTGFTQYY
jgi:hypothetical protein